MKIDIGDQIRVIQPRAGRTLRDMTANYTLACTYIDTGDALVISTRFCHAVQKYAVMTGKISLKFFDDAAAAQGYALALMEGRVRE